MAEIDTHHEARVAAAKDYQERQKKRDQRRPTPEEIEKDLFSLAKNEHYEVVGDKVIKKTRTDLGTYSTYVGRKKDLPVSFFKDHNLK